MSIFSRFSRKSDSDEGSGEREMDFELDTSDLIGSVDDEAKAAAVRGDEDQPGAQRAERPQPKSPRVHELEKFTSDFRNIVTGIEMLTEALARTRSELHQTGSFLPTIESEFHRNALIESDNSRLADDNLRKERQVKVIETAIAEKDAMAEAMKIRESELSSELEVVRKRLNDGRTALAATEETVLRLERDVEKANEALNLANEANLKLEHENQSMRERNSVLAADLNKALKQESEVRRRYDEFTNRFDAETRRYQSMASEYETAKRETARLQKERADLKTRLDSLATEKLRLEEDSNEMTNRMKGELYAQRSELNNLESRLRLFEQAERDLLEQLSEAKHGAQNAEREKMTMAAELDSSRRELDSVKRELSAKTANLSEVNLRYMSDLMGLDYQKQQNEELKNTIKSLSAENQRLTQFQAMYKAAEEQISDMRAKLESMSRSPVEKEPTISPEGPSSSTMKH